MSVDPEDQFINTIKVNIEKNGFPEQKVSLPHAKVMAAAEAKGLDLEMILSRLGMEGVRTKVEGPKLIFSHNSFHSEEEENPLDNLSSMLGGMDLSSLSSMFGGGGKDMSGLASMAQKFMGKMSPEQQQQMMGMLGNMTPEQQEKLSSLANMDPAQQEQMMDMYANMSPEEQKQMMDKAKDMGLL